MNEFFKLRPTLWGLFDAAAFVGIVGTISGFLGQFAWWLDICAHFRVQYMALFAVLAVCYFAGRKRAWGFACLAMLIVNAVPVVAFLLPTAKYDSNAYQTAKVVQLNVNTAYGKPDEVMQYLRKESPDILILEEINDKWTRLLRPILETYPIQKVEARDDNFGIGLYARVETTAAQIVYFGSSGVPSIVADMRLEGRPFTLIATHPVPPGGRAYSAWRNEQLRKLADFVRASQGALILFGDLNVTPWSPHYRRFIADSGLHNSSQGRALHASWPTFSLLLRIPIDHCLHSDGIAIKSKRIGEATGSDHFPVIVDFSLK